MIILQPQLLLIMQCFSSVPKTDDSYSLPYPDNCLSGLYLAYGNMSVGSAGRELGGLQQHFQTNHKS